MITRCALLSALGALALTAAAGPASAAVVEIGKTASPVAAPTCPKNLNPSDCTIVLPHTTAFQTTSDGRANPVRVGRAGWIVSFTVGLGQVSNDPKKVHNVLHVLDNSYGGTPQVMLTVLRGNGTSNGYKVVAQSQSFHVIPFLGKVVQQPLSSPPKFTTFTALPVRRGDVLAVTTPTWAPMLTFGLDSKKFVYRQSRTGNCASKSPPNTAQRKVGASTRYLCSYTGTRVEYSATEITNSPYPKKYPHATRVPLRPGVG